MPEPLFRRAALAAGRTDAELRRAVRRGDFTRLTPGVHLGGEGTRHLDDVDRHAIHARAAAVKLGPSAAISHISAAVLHGLDVWRTDLARVHTTNGRGSGGQRSTTRHVHTGTFDRGDVVDLSGVVARFERALRRSRSVPSQPL
ncbi:MAG: hypothetical protein WAX14_09930 [Rhodococcus sp. (in: high G+C Gram-positive bacteria)]|uniref:hypothetical protein n=1 Tax=Rhodococcus sp. TaxID=1831 RepID=UPI003BB70F4D